MSSNTGEQDSSKEPSRGVKPDLESSLCFSHGMSTAPIPLAKALCVDSRELIPESWVAVDKQGLDGVAASWLSTLPAVRSSVRNKLETSAHGTEAMFPRCLLLDALSHRVR